MESSWFLADLPTGDELGRFMESRPFLAGLLIGHEPLRERRHPCRR